MRLSTVVVSSLAAVATAAPTWPSFNIKELANPMNALDSLSGYFNLIASKVEAAKAIAIAPTCDVSKAKMPTVEGLPPPSQGLSVHHVVVGRGTQNYTCDEGEDAKPKAAGAVATLFNVTCMASMYPDVTNRIPGMAVHFNLDNADRLGPRVLPVSGHHYFTSEGVPYFDLGDIGQAPTAKNSSAAPPLTASAGQGGEPAVTWLKLLTVEGATEGIQEVYRVSTAGGTPPATCKGMPSNFEVEYAAEYWFWSG